VNVHAIALSLVFLAPFAADSRAEVVYDNTLSWTFSNGVLSGAEWADDVHLTAGGMMSSFTFGYISNGSSQATVRFYVNDAANSQKPVAGTHFYAKTVGIPGGGSSGLMTVTVSPPVPVGQDLWMSIQFNAGSGAIQLHNPPVIGSSNANMCVHVPSGTWGNVFGSGKNSFQFAIEIADPQWLDHGHALAGTQGSPKLAASGTLQSGATYSLALSDARPNAPAWLILGASFVNAPLFSGVLVPSPDVVFPLATDPAGAISIAGVTPAGVPSGVPVIAQFWILDPVAVAGYAASNARSAKTP
jgi:hypothetical protein